MERGRGWKLRFYIYFPINYIVEIWSMKMFYYTDERLPNIWFKNSILKTQLGIKSYKVL